VNATTGSKSIRKKEGSHTTFLVSCNSNTRTTRARSSPSLPLEEKGWGEEAL